MVRPFCFERVTGFEIGRKLQSNLSVGPNSPVDCLSAKAATGGNPVIRTKENGRATKALPFRYLNQIFKFTIQYFSRWIVFLN